ncbi:quinone oxidoreductase family protein [Tengunoibacter tsumagoiensis]|uniref:NADPH:quinone reductase n=1 Tax=Tengunoibacter tsumagoiensis TaxID=2014871 RepID=A0A401ZZV0_9CHLR|nr:zinc-binding alcohol dehydrogenase family protein [Tengunoibacter tsumagoiensis]GCE12373.1 NADPH:quinone reductase [Tengunoibacter tsumagoiensis]
MKAITFQSYNEPWLIVDLPEPSLEPGQILVKMSFATLNHRDLNIHAGMFHGFPPPMGATSQIMGIEGSGTIVESRDEMQTFPIGTRVFFREAYNLPHGGTWQEYVVASPADVIAIPEGHSLTEAAALRQSYQSALLALELGKAQFDAQSRQTILAPGVGSAVGNATIQLMRAYGLSNVITTAGQTTKLQRAQEAGYERIIDLSQETLYDGVMRLTHGEGVDLVVEILGGAYTQQALTTLKRGRTLVVVGFVPGNIQLHIPIFDILAFRRGIVGMNILLTPQQERDRAIEKIVELWYAGRIHPLVDQIFPFTEIEQAQRYYKEGRPFGKVLLRFE